MMHGKSVVNRFSLKKKIYTNVQKVRIRIPEVTGNGFRKYSHFRVQSLHFTKCRESVP